MTCFHIMFSFLFFDKSGFEHSFYSSIAVRVQIKVTVVSEMTYHRWHIYHPWRVSQNCFKSSLYLLWSSPPGTDPATDLRACGFLGLMTLLHFVMDSQRLHVVRDIYKLSLNETQVCQQSNKQTGNVFCFRQLVEVHNIYYRQPIHMPILNPQDYHK